MIKRLRFKFICINMAIVTAMLLVIFGMVLHFTRMNLENQSMALMQSVLEDRVHPGRPGEGRGEVRLPWFRVTQDLLGQQVVISDSSYDLSDQDTIQAILRQARQSDAQSGILRSYRLRFAKSHTLTGEQLVFVDASSEIAIMNGLLKICACIGLLSFSVFLAISILLARWAIRPVERAWEQQRQFVADASHELKTPLTVIMTNAELLEDCRDEADRRQFLEGILTMSRQMRALVESLLELARVDNGAAQTAFTPLDLSELVSGTLLVFEPLFFERQLLLEGATQPGLWVRGSATHLKQVLDILLDNAAKYSAPGGTVAVRLERQGSHALLQVTTPGEPLSAQERQNIFKRFYRADKARSRTGSYGLGLPIAQGIVESHGGRIWVTAGPGDNTFQVRLPLVQGRPGAPALPEG